MSSKKAKEITIRLSENNQQLDLLVKPKGMLPMKRTKFYTLTNLKTLELETL